MADWLTWAIADLRTHFWPALGGAVWQSPSKLAVIVVCTSVVYLFLVFFMQFSRRSMLGHSSMLDLVLMLVIANGVQNAMVAGDNSLIGGLTAALTLFAWEGALGYVRRKYPHTRRFLGGERIKILENGVPLNERIVREHLEVGALEEAMEQQQISPKQVCDAYLEVDGSITLIPKSRARVKRRSQVAAPRRGESTEPPSAS